MPEPNQSTAEFKATKVKVLNSLLLYMTIGSMPLLATSLLIFYSSGWKASMIIDAIGLMSIPVIYFLRHRIPYIFKTSYLILIGYAAALMVLHDYSFFGTGFIILSSITLISTLFFGMRTGWLLMAVNLAVIALIGLLYQFNIITYTFDFEKYIHSSLTWLDHVATFLFFIGLVVIASGQIHNALIKLNRQANAEKEKFIGLFHNIQDAILIYSKEGRILEINDSLLKLFGLERSSALAKKIGDFSIVTLKEGQHVRNGRRQYETKARRFDNKEEFYVEVMLSSIEFGDENAVLVNIRDISERKLAEVTLRQSEKKYRSLIESSPAGIFIVKQNNFLYVNPAGVRSLGYRNYEELAGKSIFEILAPEFRRPAELRMEKAQWKIINAPTELKLFRADGSEMWAETVSLPFEFNGIPAVLIMGFDITQRKKAEELILLKNQEIENRNSELKIAKDRAEESDRLKSAFLSNMSHEIRTPMNAILGFSDLLIKATLSEKKKHEYIKIINSSGTQLLSIINDIIDISKIESNQIVIDNSTQVDLNDIFKHLSVIFSPKTKEKKIALEYSVKLLPEKSGVYLDEIRLHQILFNLIGNSVKFTHSGFVRFEVSLVSKDELLFTVEDSGIGIQPELQAIIFERFRQADGSTTRDYGGTGLGLAISKALVELMGGRIWLNSIPEKGTTFYFTLPYRHEPGKVLPLTLPAEESNGEQNWTGKNILLVEDEEVNILFLMELFKQTGANILSARNADEAYSKFGKGTDINLVLMDIRIPEVDGYEITREIKKSHPGIPVIAQTAYALAEERKQILNSGFDDYISKPINKGVLFDLISRYLDK